MLKTRFWTNEGSFVVLGYNDFIKEQLIKKQRLLTSNEIIDPFIEYFTTKPPFIKKLDTELRFKYNNFKIAIKYKDKKIFFIYVKTPEDKDGQTFLKRSGFGDLIDKLENNAIKKATNENSKARIYFFNPTNEEFLSANNKNELIENHRRILNKIKNLENILNKENGEFNKNELIEKIKTLKIDAKKLLEKIK